MNVSENIKNKIHSHSWIFLLSSWIIVLCYRLLSNPSQLSIGRVEDFSKISLSAGCLWRYIPIQERELLQTTTTMTSYVYLLCTWYNPEKSLAIPINTGNRVEFFTLAGVRKSRMSHTNAGSCDAGNERKRAREKVRERKIY